jgi:hypothetical protein
MYDDLRIPYRKGRTHLLTQLGPADVAIAGILRRTPKAAWPEWLQQTPPGHPYQDMQVVEGLQVCASYLEPTYPDAESQIETAEMFLSVVPGALWRFGCRENDVQLVSKYMIE